MSDSLMLSVSLTAGPLKVTGHDSAVTKHQTVVNGSDGGTVYLYFSPAMARQWVAALSPIAEADQP